jgi:hypothetical protein
MNKKKNRLSLLLLFIVTAPLCIFLCLFGKQQYIQYQMEERLEALALTTIELPNNTFVWLKNGGEIQINDQLFDVKSFVVKENTTLFTGLYDKDEVAIKKQLQYLFQQERENENPTKLSFLKLSFTPALKPDAEFEISFKFFNTAKKYLFFRESIVQQFLDVVITPPIA